MTSCKKKIVRKHLSDDEILSLLGESEDDFSDSEVEPCLQGAEDCYSNSELNSSFDELDLDTELTDSIDSEAICLLIHYHSLYLLHKQTLFLE